MNEFFFVKSLLLECVSLNVEMRHSSCLKKEEPKLLPLWQSLAPSLVITLIFHSVALETSTIVFTSASKICVKLWYFFPDFILMFISWFYKAHFRNFLSLKNSAIQLSSWTSSAEISLPDNALLVWKKQQLNLASSIHLPNNFSNPLLKSPSYLLNIIWSHVWSARLADPRHRPSQKEVMTEKLPTRWR